MAVALQVRLLGRPTFTLGGKPLACASQKAMWLAAHVMLTRARHPRARIAGLLWGAGSPRHALGSLRVALTKLPPEVLARLEVSRDAIGVAEDAVLDIDVEAFVAGCASSDIEQQRRALPLYAGELLEGAQDDLAPEFSDWLFAERTRLRSLAADAHARVAQALHARGERERAREVVDAWLKRDPANETMHKLAMNWLAQGSDGDQALAHYEVYRRARAVAHGAPPSEEMAALADRLRHGHEAPLRETPARIAAATSFFGRNDELAELRGLLADPACRLLTLHGLGGVGKTRLALALAETQSAAFGDGVHVVALDGVQDPRHFAQTIARACGLQPSGNAAPLDLVASFLSDRSALLVLDNLEHLLGGADADPHSIPAQIAQLLRMTGPRVKILATSREPLRLQEEWVYELDGLAYPRIVGNTMGDAQSYSAVQFFAQRARQAYVGFSLAAELPNVVQICEVLEGLPLGLELAASWVRNVPCAEIAASIRERAAELRNRHVNRVGRHHTLGAVVAYSWERLPAEQREALCALGVLVGTFSREAAEQVAQAGVRSLSALVEKSLLQRAGRGRWHLHEVVRQYAWEQPDASAKARIARQAATAKRRDAFYTDFLRGIRARLDGSDEADAIAAMEIESPNIREAWRASARSANVEALDAAAPAWFEFLEGRSYVAEGIATAEEWLDASRRANAAVSTGRALVKLGLFRRFGAQTTAALTSLDEAVAILEEAGAAQDLGAARAARAFTYFLLGRLDDARAEAQRALDIAAKLGDGALTTSACRTMGLAVLQSGRREEGRDLQRRALEVATALGKPSLLAAAHNNIALAENHLGNHRAAEAGYESALALWKDLNATVNVGRAMHNLGVVATRMENHALALDRYRAALEYLRKAGDRNLIALNLMSTGDALVRLDRPEEGRTTAHQALRMAEHDGHMLPALDARIVIAQADVALGNHKEAALQLSAVLEGAEKHHFANVLADGVVGAARLVAAAVPDEAPSAKGWALAIAELSEASLTVRADARHIAALVSSAPAPAPRDLPGLAHAAAEKLGLVLLA